MHADKNANYFQVIKSVLYRDGIKNTCFPRVFKTYGDAMSVLTRLDRKAQPFEHYSIRGVYAGDPATPEDYRPHIRDKRPVKAYAVQVSEYTQGQEPEGYSRPWCDAWGRGQEPEGYSRPWYEAWGRGEREAKYNYLHRYGGRRAPRICAVVELPQEAEKEIRNAETEATAQKLAGLYGEQALCRKCEEDKKQ